MSIQPTVWRCPECEREFVDDHLLRFVNLNCRCKRKGVAMERVSGPTQTESHDAKTPIQTSSQDGAL